MVAKGMEENPQEPDESRLVLGHAAAEAFWRFYRVASIFVLGLFWIIGPVLCIDALGRGDFGSLAFALVLLLIGSLAGLAFVRLANRTLEKIRAGREGVRRMV